MSWLSGCDLLVIQADDGEATVFTTLARFEEILAAAAEGLAEPTFHKEAHPAPIYARSLKSRPFPTKSKFRKGLGNRR